MPKDYFQDITPPGGTAQGGARDAMREFPREAPHPDSSNGSGFERTIRNIPINPRRHPLHTAAGATSSAGVSALGGASLRGMRWIKKYIFGAVALVAVLAISVFIVALLRGTSVVVTPRTHTIVLTEDVPLTAYPATDKTAAPGSLLYDTASNTYEAEQAVTAAGFEDVEEYARGVVTIYNEHSVTPLRLIKNTRVEGAGGLIFRIRDSVVVPGKKGQNPGTLTATIYADQPGDKYNIAPTDRFTLPGLKNSPNDTFAHVYARSVVAFSGGFAGSRPKIADADLEAARSALRAGLEEKARTEAAHLKPEGVIVFPQLLTINFEALSPEKGADGQVRVRERAVVTLPAFNEALFAKVLATATRADLGDAVVHIKDASGMTVRKITLEDKPAGSPLDLVVSGSATLIWEVDPSALAAALAGTPKETFKKVTEGFAGIEKADAYIRPMWKGTFPADPSAISVILNESNEPKAP